MSHSSEPSDAKGPKIVAECEASGEPYFVLRAKDVFSLEALIHYLELFVRRGPDDESYSDAITSCASEFVHWRDHNPEKVRYPD